MALAGAHTAVALGNLFRYVHNRGLNWLWGRTDWRGTEYHQLGQRYGFQIFPNAETAQAQVKIAADRWAGDPLPCVVIRPDDRYEHGSIPLAQAMFSQDSAGQRKLSLRLGVFNKTNEDVTFFGYRFEMPEGAGSHNFFHVQPIQGFSHAQFDGCVDWYPDKYPTVPLLATDEVELSLAMVLSVGGADTIRELAQSVDRNQLLAVKALQMITELKLLE